MAPQRRQPAASRRNWGSRKRFFGQPKRNYLPTAATKRPLPVLKFKSPLGNLGVKKLDLVQVHNLANLKTELAVLKDLKRQGLIRYLGVTTTFRGQYNELANCMRDERLDFIGIDYAIDDREVEKRILPLAMDRGIAVLGYVPFGRSNLFKRGGRSNLPEWAQKAGMKTWAQFFLKFVIGHPAITVVTPATSQPSHMLENLSGGIAPFPDEPMRRRMIAVVDDLPG